MKNASPSQLTERPSTLRELKDKINEINLNIKSSRQKIEIISSNTARDRSFENISANHFPRQYQILDQSIQPIFETSNRIVSEKLLELKFAQQKAEETGKDIERIKLDELSAAEKRIHKVIEECERAKLRLRQEFEAHTEIVERDLKEKINEIKLESERAIERRLKTYHYELAHTDHPASAKETRPIIYEHFTSKEENTRSSPVKDSRNLADIERHQDNTYNKPTKEKKLMSDVANDIESRLHQIRNTISNFKTRSTSEQSKFVDVINALDENKPETYSERKNTMKLPASLEEKNPSRHKQKYSMQLVMNESSSEDDDDFEKYLALKRKLQNKKGFDKDHKQSKHKLARLL